MNIPEKGFDPIIEKDWRIITVFTSSNANNPKSKTVKLPQWLSRLVANEIDLAYNRGRREIRDKLKSILGFYE